MKSSNELAPLSAATWGVKSSGILVASIDLESS